MSEPTQPECPVEAKPEKFYLTTPIYYVNARPHIGHAYSTIVADVLARRHRLLGDDVFFLTGTDEHGQKIERSAAAAGIPPQEFADQVSKTFSDLWKRMGITNDAFIRTTDERHKRGVQRLFQTLYDQGHIYLSTYTGQYSIGEEMFVDGPPGTIGPDGRPTETVTEENFFFRLSAFQQPLIDLIESNTLRITPDSSRNEVLSFIAGNVSAVIDDVIETHDNPALASQIAISLALESGRLTRSSAETLYVPGALRDLSVSRSSFTWGISIPIAVQKHAGATQRHVIYVWLDALANYMTAIGYGSGVIAHEKRFAQYWPADLHLVGKEITRFHCVYWPAFLLAAGLTTPRQVTANGWLLFENSKMSKSKGNVVRTETILDAFGEHVYKKQFPDSRKPEQDLFATDVLRFFLLREIPFGQDGAFSFDSMVTRYNADLANGYGNLVSRTLSMIEKYVDGFVPDYASADRLPALQASIASASLQIGSARDGSGSPDFAGTLAEFWRSIALVDTYISMVAPWKLAKSPDPNDRRALLEALYIAAESIRLTTAFLQPFLPNATAKVWSQLGLGDIEQAAKNGDLKNLQWGGLKPGTKLGPLSPIFPRADKSLSQIMADIELASQPASKETQMPTAEPTTDTSQQPAVPTDHPAEPLKEHGDPVPATTPTDDPTHPAAPPRSASLDIPNPGAQVAASHAISTERDGTPSHTEAQASGIFSSTAGAAQPIPDTPQITIDDFTKIDLRVAKILVAERIPKADKLLRLEVDLGYEQRQILSGIAEHYTPEELIGRKIVIIANLAPRRMRGLESRGMLLAASEGENGKPILATFGEDIAVGTRLR